MDTAALEEKINARPDLLQIAEVQKALLIFLIVLGLVVLYRFVRARAWRDWAGPPPAPRTWTHTAVAVAFAALALAPARARALGFEEVVASVLGIAVIATLVAGVLAWRERTLAPIGIPGRAPERAAGAGVLAFVGVFPIFCAAQIASRAIFRAAGVEPTANPAATLISEEEAWSRLLATAALAAFVAPVAEEILFRGFIYGALRRRLGFPAAALGSAALFALVHPAVDWLPIVVLAIALAGAYDKTGSLAAPIACHVANNVVGVLQLLVVRYLARA